MTYKIEGKYFELSNEDAAEIRKNMKEFDISMDDAARMFFEDWEYIPAGSKVKIERVKDLQTKKEYAKAEKPRNAKPRERKVDETKGNLLAGCRVYLEGKGANVIAVKPETEINFEYEGASYTLKLTKHRAPK